MKNYGLVACVLLTAVFAFTHEAKGSVVLYLTPENASVADGPVNASVALTIDGSHLSIFVENHLANPTSVGQNISSIRFTIEGGLTDAVLNSSSCIGRTIVKPKQGALYTDSGPTSTYWTLSMDGMQLLLSALGHGQPKYTVIGPPDDAGIYSDANGSIAGNKPHNPFAAGSATFDLNLYGIAENFTVSNVAIGFGTTSGRNFVYADEIPEPVTLSILAIGGLFLTRFQKRQAAVN